MKQSNVAIISENEYSELLKTAVTQIESGRNSIALQLNTTANSTYWNLGKLLHDRQIEGGYGSNIINRLSVDLKNVFPDMGLSPRNLWNMKLFYERYAESDKKLLQAVAVLQWGHNLLLINKKLSDDETYYYALESVSKGWNRDMLLNAIKMDCFALNKNEIRDNNFSVTLPDDQATRANEILKDSYNLGFLGITKPIAVSDYELFVPKKELQSLIIEEIKEARL